MEKTLTPRPSEAGYNLVILMVAMTLFNIALALALPKWSHVIRREKEEELISRGFQYAEAIRVFQNRFQRLPVRVQELAEVEPRSIRKLWKDPMTDDGKWVLIPPGQNGQTLNPKDESGRDETGEVELGGNGDEKPSEELPDNTGIGEKKGTVQVGPFVGVHSRSGKETILVLFGHNRYDEWHFTVDLLTQGRTGNQMPPPDPTGGAGNPAMAGGLQLSTRWLGRPLPAFLDVQNGQMPNGETPKRPGGPGTGTAKPLPR